MAGKSAVPFSAPSRGRSLVALTTCGRPGLVAKHLPGLQAKVKALASFELVLVIDGISLLPNRETLALAQRMGVNCIIADQPEGVGVAKNRVMSLLGDYDFYFFIEDDVEVLSSDLFTGHLSAYQETGIHHFSLHEPSRLLEECQPTFFLHSTKEGSGEKKMIRHARFGSAQVNFFSRQALARVGGWHRQFSRLRRGGHTEHSYRIFNAGLTPAPFNYIGHLDSSCRWHNPPSIVSCAGHPVAANRLFEIENTLISQQLGPQAWYAEYPGRLCLHGKGGQDAYCYL
ncbi:hypothetical protein SG34_014730 [Thalassomonas viridans]|uniref:Glycosyltransferase 2-like domain-containing protein n=1 Tax=Thalassomonas viridans TaxID=137584 RepID=A0AAE9ZA23_9GAMM|nr:hypothetical protein [Thalassomonas viridans]WDE08033.1 hypothetical protein SG34_014730 [Thalassomonas viridans]